VVQRFHDYWQNVAIDEATSDTDVQWSIRYRGALLCWHRYIVLNIPSLYLYLIRSCLADKLIVRFMIVSILCRLKNEIKPLSLILHVVSALFVHRTLACTLCLKNASTL